MHATTLPRLASLLFLSSTPCIEAMDAPSSDRAVCAAIARDIEAARPEFPALREFVADRALAPDAPRLTYEFKCRPSTNAVGWQGGVPEPERDGAWFHIELWDPADPGAASAQINTQALTEMWRIGERRVTFLLRAGKDSPGLEPAIRAILQKHGMKADGLDASFEPLFLASPEEAVAVATELLRQQDFNTLARYYDLTGTGLQRETLDNEAFFMRTERPEAAHPAGFWRYRQPFAPGFKYVSHEATDQPSVHRVRLRIEIDQGGGSPQVGLADFLMRQSPAGWQFLPAQE